MIDLQKPGLPATLLDLLQNTLVLSQISPYVGIASLVSLATASTSFRDLLYGTPQVFQHTDLTRLKSCLRYTAQRWPSRDECEERLSTDEFYAQPLRVVFHCLQERNVLQDIRTLVLDGLAVPADILREMLCVDAYNIRILSLRGVKELGDEKLIQLLRYIIRPSRPEGTPKLKGLYYFTPKGASADFSAANLRGQQYQQQAGVTNALGAQLGAGASSSGAIHRHLIQSSWHHSNEWYSDTGEILRMPEPVQGRWVQLIQACEGLIAFDAVVCRHTSKQFSDASAHFDLPIDASDRGLASVSLGGCQKCGSCPEGPGYPRESPENRIPLLAPPPLHSSKVRNAQRLEINGLPHPPFIARCRTCLKDRWCERCNVWWCESCYTVPSKRMTAFSMNETPMGAKNLESSIQVHNNLCVSKCLMGELLNGVGEGGMWG